MKRFIAVISATILVLGMFCGCASEKKEPQEEQIKAICELATIKCYYNNVAKGTKAAGKGWRHLLEKDRKFWVEYEGVATIGIDMNQVTMTIAENTVEVTMPKAELFSVDIKESTLNDESYIVSDDGFWNKNLITAEEQQATISVAQETMKETVLKNKALFARAEEEAKDRISKYIEGFSKLNEEEYTITWKSI